MSAERDALARRIAMLRARQHQLEARDRERQRKRATHAAVVVGSLVLHHPALFGLSPDGVREILGRAVVRPHDRRALGLDGVEPSGGPSGAVYAP